MFKRTAVKGETPKVDYMTDGRGKTVIITKHSEYLCFYRVCAVFSQDAAVVCFQYPGPKPKFKFYWSAGLNGKRINDALNTLVHLFGNAIDIKIKEGDSSESPE